MKKITPKKKMKTWQKLALFISLLIFLVIGLMIGNADEAPAESQAVKATDWKEMKYEQREEWINNYLKHPDDNGYALVTYMSDAVKKQFNYPEEVDFDWGESPILNKGRVVDADTGFVFFNGRGTAKNAFGVKSKFRYSIRTIIRPDSLRIDNVSVSEDK